MLIPQSVSYGTSLAKIGPTAGLVSIIAFIHNQLDAIFSCQFSASIPPIAYSLLGTSRQLNVAPEAALSLLVGQAVSEYRHMYPNSSPDELGIAVATAIGLQVRFHNNLIRTLDTPTTRLDYSRSSWVSFASAFWTLSSVAPFSADL